MKLPLEFTVYGIPQSAGSKRGFPIRRANGSLGVAMSDANPRARDWKLAVREAALLAPGFGGKELLDEPLSLEVVFYMPRPKSHFHTGRRANQLRPDAPTWHVSKPDTTKLVRCLEDALTGVVWADDCRVTYQIACKTYGDRPGADVIINKANKTLDRGIFDAAFRYRRVMLARKAGVAQQPD